MKDTLQVAICEAGRRFFWTVQFEWEAPLAYGYADSRDDAEDQMWTHAIMQARLHDLPVPASESDAQAAEYGRRLVRIQELGDTGEFVYPEYSSVPCPIRKMTAKRVYVEKGDKIYSLDRLELESMGVASSNGIRFYSEDGERQRQEQIEQDEIRKALTRLEEKRAYKALVASITPEEQRHLDRFFSFPGCGEIRQQWLLEDKLRMIRGMMADGILK